MELRHFRAIVAIKECGSFTAAAHRLNMEQPPLSQQIRKIEETLGLRLFDRSRRGATLTPAGAQLLDKAQDVLAADAAFHALARGLASGDRGKLRIGLVASLILLPLVPRAMQTFRERWPDVAITVEESNTPALCEALRNGRIDVAIVRPPVFDADINVQALMDEPTVIVLPAGHHCAKNNAIRLTDISNEPLIIFDREIGPGFYDTIIGACLEAGFSPKLGQVAPQVAATIAMVAAGMGVGIVPRYLKQIHTGGVTFHPIKGPKPRATIAIASRQNHLDTFAQNFVSILRDLL